MNDKSNHFRSLILAGGGIKVGYQGGCLQVLLDEAGLQFDHIDGASGGCFNAIMMCSGMSGKEIADNWRNLNPFDMISFNWAEYYKLYWARSISTLDKLRSEVFPKWGLNWQRIRDCRKPVGTFNIYNFSKKKLLTIENRDMDEDLLVASVALPMWFPPVIRQSEVLFDAVYCTDGNVGEGVRRGADEMWSVWTVADQPEYRNGFLAQYFHIIETASDTRFFREWEEIEAVNQAIAQHGADTSRPAPDLQMREGYQSQPPGWRPPPGRKPIDLHLIKQEVPIHYLINVSRDRMAETVEMGVRDAREYCRKAGLLSGAPVVTGPTSPVTHAPIGVEFTETMKGFFTPGENDPEKGEQQGKKDGNRLDFRITIHAGDLDKFIHFPEHEASVTGWVESQALGGRMDVTQGRFNLFVIEDQAGPQNPGRKQMLYHLNFRSPDGKLHLLDGVKQVHENPNTDMWADLTTLFTKVYRVDGQQQTLVGSGVLHIHLLDFMQQLTTFRVHDAGSPAASMQALNRFGQFFMGQVWDVYERHIMDYAPF